jgi:hypothetical protein
MSDDFEARLRRVERQGEKRGQHVRLPQPLNIIDFVTNPAFLGAGLYPAQALILKLLTLSSTC